MKRNIYRAVLALGLVVWCTTVLQAQVPGKAEPGLKLPTGRPLDKDLKRVEAKPLLPKSPSPLTWDGTLGTAKNMPFAKDGTLLVKTKGGAGRVHVTFLVNSNSSQFRHSPATTGSSAAGQAVMLPQSRVEVEAAQLSLNTDPADPVSKTIYYVGSPGGIPPTSPVMLTVTATDNTGAKITQNVAVTLTRANGTPVMTALEPTDNRDTPHHQGAFSITVSGDTWSPDDEGADIIAIYDGNFHYGVEKLPAVKTENNAKYTVIFDDINKGKIFKVYLKNVYGSSLTRNATLPTYEHEAFPAFPLSPATAGQRFYGLTNHPEIGVNVIPNSTGIDQFSLSNVASERGKVPACGENSIYYVGVKMIEMDSPDVGAVTVQEQPSTNAPFDPDGKVKIKWVTQIGGKYSYQTHFAFKRVAGICPARKRN